MNPLDPSPYSTSWGVLGALVFVIVLLGGIIYSLFIKGAAQQAARDAQQAAEQQARDKMLMDFVDRHRGESSTALAMFGDSVVKSNERMREAFLRQSRTLDAVLLSTRVLDHAERRKTGSSALTQTEIDQIISSVMKEPGMRGDG